MFKSDAVQSVQYVLSIASFVITDFQRRAIKVDSSEGVKLIDDVNTTNFDPKFQDRYWRIENIHLIHNDKINHQYEDYRQELSQLVSESNWVKFLLGDRRTSNCQFNSIFVAKLSLLYIYILLGV